MIIIPIPGNIEIEINKYEMLFDLIYSCTSDEISLLLENAANRLKKDAEKKLKSKLTHEYMLLKGEEYSLLSSLSTAFKELQETPKLLLIEQ